MIQAIDSPTVSDIRTLCDVGFQIGKKRNRVPLLRGLQFGYMIIPVVLANDISDDVRDYVTQQPRKQWALLEFPVVCAARSNDTYYFKGTPLWGAFFFSNLRHAVSKNIE